MGTHERVDGRTHRPFLYRLRHPLFEFTPRVRWALRTEILAVLTLSVFTSFTGPFTGIVLRRQFGATAEHFTLIAWAAAGSLLLSLLWARFIARRPPLPYVVWPALVGRGLYLLTPLVRSAAAMVGLVMAANVLQNMSGPAQAALVQRLYPRPQRGRALGMIRTAGALVGIGLTALGGAAIALVGFRAVFALAGLAGIAASLRLRELRVPVEKGGPIERVSIPEAWAAVRDDRRFRLLLGVAFVFGIAIWIQVPANPILFVDVLGVSPGQMGVFAAVAAAAGLLGNAAWGRLADRRPSVEMLAAVYAVGVLVPGILALARHPWLVAATMAAEALMATGLDLVWMLVVIDAAGPQRVAAYAAISATLAGIRGLVGPLLGTTVMTVVGIREVYALAAALMLFSIVLVRRLGREKREGSVEGR